MGSNPGYLLKSFLLYQWHYCSHQLALYVLQFVFGDFRDLPILDLYLKLEKSMFSLCICKFKWIQTKIFQEYRKSASKDLLLSFSQKLHQYHIHNFASMFAIQNSKRIPKRIPKEFQKNSQQIRTLQHYITKQLIKISPKNS